MESSSEIRSVEAVLDEVDGFPYAESRLSALASEAGKAEIEPFLIAFGYHFVGHDDEEGRARAEDAYGASIEFDNRRFPPPLKALPSEVIDRWAAAVKKSSHSALCARLHDLLWVVREGDRPDLHAREGSDAYRAVAERSDWHSLERADALARALELARSVGDTERCEAAESSICELLGKALSSDPESDLGSPGVVMTLLRALSDLGRMPDARLDELLLRAESRFASDAHLRDCIADLREPIIGAEERRNLRRRQVQRWREVADGASGMLRAIHLEHALELARLHQLADDERALLLQLQEVSVDDLELKEVSTEIKLPTGELQKLVEAIVGAEDRWDSSLLRFGNYGPPGGTDEAIQERVAEQMKKAPLQFLVTKVVYGPTGASIFRAADDVSHKYLAAAENRTLAARLWSMVAVLVLEEVRDRGGKPAESEVAEFFTTELIPADVAASIARSLDLYWDGHFDEAGHMLAPRLERIIRELAHRAGIPIIAPPENLRPGRVRGLGSLLGALEGVFAEDAWRAYLKNLLADPLGVNLRNVVGHALQPEVSQAEVALLIHAACYLRLLGAQSTSDSSE